MSQQKLPGRRQRLACLVATLFGSTGWAAGDNPETLLPVVVTTATRTEMALEGVPGSVSVKTAADIEKTPRASVKEIVRNLEGVVTGQLRGQSDLAPSITLRGVPDQSRTMILVDGIPLNTSYSGQAQALGGLVVDDLQQVEVVRGPFSSLYGSSAMGGAVNFITRLPDKPEYRASLGYGNAFESGRAQPMLQGYLSAAERLGDDLMIKLSHGWTDSRGYRSDILTSAYAPAGGVSGAEAVAKVDGSGSQYIIGNTGRGEMDKSNWDLRAEWKADDSDTLGASFTRSQLHNQYADPQSLLRNASGDTVFSAATTSAANPILASKFLANINDVTNSLSSLSWKHRYADSRLSLRYARLAVDEWYSAANSTTGLSGGAGQLTPRHSLNQTLDLLWEKPLGDSVLLLGSQYKYTESLAETYNLSEWRDESTRGTRKTASGGKEKVWAAFADWQFPLTAKWSGSAGARAEHWRGIDGFTSDFDNPANTTLNRQYDEVTHVNVSPKLTSTYQLLDETRLKASWGKAFRAPDALNLYRNYVLGSTTSGTYYVANPDLRPETSQSFDLGIEQQTPHNGLFKAYLFHTDITDLISSRIVDYWPTGRVKTRQRVNIDQVSTEGIELSLRQPLFSTWSLSASYTHLNPRVIRNAADPLTEGKRLTSMPSEMFNLGLVYDDSRFFAVLAYEYANQRYFNDYNTDVVSGVPGAYDAYGLTSGKLGYRLNRNCDLSLAVSNLEDKKFYNSVLTEGRAWFAQANARF